MLLPTPFSAPPIPQTDLLSLLFERPPTDFPEDRIIFKDGDAKAASLTYAELRTRFRKVGFNLQQKAGVRKGDRVGILALHGTHYPCALYGILCAGAQAVPMNPMLLTSDIIHYIKVTNLKTIIVDDMFYKTLEGALVHYPGLTVIVRGKVPPSKSGKTHMSFDDLLGGTSELSWPRGPSTNKSTAFICFSSGTGGMPKAVTLTHENIVANQHLMYYASQHQRRMQQGGLHNVIVSGFPPFHMAGIWGSMVDPIYDGSTAIIMSIFNLELYLKLIKEHKPTDLSAAPPIILLLATSPLVNPKDFDSVERLNVGAAPLSKELADACVARLNPRMKLRQVVSLPSTMILTNR
jgi:acyl-CoA synthetase (AMP-forming)/AMP-acid ligase II